MWRWKAVRHRLIALVLAFSLVSPALGQSANGNAFSNPSTSPDPYPSTYKPLPRSDTFIRDATILDGTGHKIERGSISLHDGKIVDIGTNFKPPVGTVTIDAHSRWVTPGLIDVHSHLGDFPMPMTPGNLKVSDANEPTDPNTAQVWALHSITVQDPQFSRVRAAGVTTLQVLPGSINLFGGRGVVLKNVPATTVQEMEFPCARASLKMACGENPKSNYGEKGRFPSSRMGNVAGYREAFIKAKEYQRKWDEYYLKHDPNAEPPTRDLKLETLAAGLRGDLSVHMHCYRADDMAIMLDVAKEFGFKITAFHHAVEAYKIADLLAKSGVCAAVWPDWWGYKMEAYDGIRANAAYLQAAGACVMLHSDFAVDAEHFNVDAAIALGAGRNAGVAITKEEAIKWITLNPAKALGLEDRIGSLEPGKNADVVVWSGDPFSVYTKADMVFIDGALVYDRLTDKQPRSDIEVGQPASEVRP
jgi:imidazolonepropionase-like amidohydrolase